jgi:hypothetical protein
MALTYYAIATVTVPATPAATIDFTSIPQTYTDLQILLSGRSNRVGDNDFPVISFNGSSTGFDASYFYATASFGSAFQSTTQSYAYINSSTFAANTFSNTMFYIPRYTDTTIPKSFLIESVVENTSIDTNKFVLMTSGGKTSTTAAISSIRLQCIVSGTNSFVQYTTATLYGIKNS